MFKKDRITTTTRVVFDASSRNSDGKSLNEQLLKGPKKQIDLQALLLKFRMKRVILIADISRMFYNIEINEDYRDYYRLLWNFEEDDGPPKIYRFRRLLMGANDSPCIAISVVHHHLDKISKEKPHLKELTTLIKENLYVDDLVLSLSSEKEAIKIRKEITDIFRGMKMKIRKWASNSSRVLATIPRDDLYPYETKQLVETDEGLEKEMNFSESLISKATKIMGMAFDPKKDKFHYKNYENLTEEKPPKKTKRGLSKIIPSIFDPNGLVQPFILRGKLLLKRAWKHKKPNGEGLSWDEMLPVSFHKDMDDWIEDIKEVSKFAVDRFLFKDLEETPKSSSLYIDAFADGGEGAFGCSIYIRYHSSDHDRYHSKLIFSSSRVAPSKEKLSIPKKELNGLLLTHEKAMYVSNILGIPPENIRIHSDSLVAIQWIKSPPEKLKVYVANRVKKIQKFCLKLLYVPGTENPADLLTKPRPTSHFVNNEFWTNGPKLLEKSNESLDSEFNLEMTLASLSNDKITDKMEEELKTSVIRAKRVTINNYKTSSEIKSPTNNKPYWGLFNRRWYVCQIPPAELVPQKLRNKNTASEVVVQFLSDKTFSAIKRTKLEPFWSNTNRLREIKKRW